MGLENSSVDKKTGCSSTSLLTTVYHSSPMGFDTGSGLFGHLVHRAYIQAKHHTHKLKIKCKVSFKM